MAHQSHNPHGVCSPGVMRLVLFMASVWLVGYIVGPRLYWHFTGRISSQASSCPACVCDCSSDALLSLPLDCSRNDPDMNEEMKKGMIQLLTEELSLQKNVTKDNIEHTRASIQEAKKTSSQYQREAEKCNTGMETCEEAREKAEAELRAERKLSAMWESRAIEHGWKDLRRVYF